MQVLQFVLPATLALTGVICAPTGPIDITKIPGFPQNLPNGTTVYVLNRTAPAAAPAPAPVVPAPVPAPAPAPSPKIVLPVPNANNTPTTPESPAAVSGIPVTQISVGNAIGTIASVSSGGGSQLGGSSGNIENSGNSIGAKLVNAENIIPGSIIQVGNTQGTKATVTSGGAWGKNGNTGAVTDSGNAINSIFDAKNGFMGSAFVGNAIGSQATVSSGNGGTLGGNSGAVSNSGNSIGQVFVSPGIKNGLLNVEFGITKDTTAQVYSSSAHGSGSTGAVANSGNAVAKKNP